MPVSKVNWNPQAENRLWRYHLHYFDYLRDDSADISPEWLDDWIQYNPQGSSPGWEPFTTSLRIVNWAFYLTLHPKYRTDFILQSLYTQALWLEKNDERHILANHYFENLKALLFAGTFFKGKCAERWLKRGKQEILKQIKEQTLTDGGHFERTPQYHSLMLENYLDILNLATTNQLLFDVEFTNTVRDHCLRALEFQQKIQFPDGSLPLFNDTTLNGSPPVQKLIEYSVHLGLSPRTDVADGMINLPDSGFFGYRFGGDMLIMDVGDIGPSYQPGHSHCDLLSFELMLSGQKVIVDTGVYEYEPGEMRKYVRSTKAHNTISIDGLEQSEVWGEFRVARRAKVLSRSTFSDKKNYTFSGAFKGFHESPNRLTHHRDIILETKADQSIGKIHVKDTITGSGVHLIESYLHMHPDIDLTQNENSIQMTKFESQVATIKIHSNISASIKNGLYCPEFGIKQKNARIYMATRNKLPVRMELQIDIH